MPHKAHSARPAPGGYAPSCRDCRGELIVAPLGLLIRLVRDHPNVKVLVAPLRDLVQAGWPVGNEVSVCPTCKTISAVSVAVWAG